MTTFGFTVFGFFDAVVVLVGSSLAFGVGAGGSTESLLAFRLFTPFVVGLAASSSALRLDLAVGLVSAGGDSAGVAAFFVVVFVAAVFVVVVALKVVVFEGAFEAALTPFT